MRTVLTPAPEFNSPRFDLHAAPSAGVTARAMGHVDECTALMADPDDTLTPGEMADGLEEWDTDRCIQAADDDHLAEARKALATIRGQLGVTPSITISRSVTVSDRGESSEWSAMAYTDTLNGHGLAATPAAAVDGMLAEIDAKTGIVPAFGGFRVPGIALILAAHDRSKVDALAFARRIALDGTYLDVLLAHHVPGVSDERGNRPAAVTAGHVAAA